MSSKSIITIAVLVALALLTAACGGSSDSSEAEAVATLETETPTAEPASGEDDVADADLAEQFEQAVLDFSACMREAGVTDFPDLNADAIVDFDTFYAEVQAAGIDFDDLEVGEKMFECQSAFGDISQFQAPASAADNQAIEEAALAIMDCIRDNGYPDVPDLDLSGGIDANVLLQLLPHVDVTSEEFQAVAGDCVAESPVDFDGRDALSDFLQG